MPYIPEDPPTDAPPQPHELNLEQDSSCDAKRPWIVGGVAGIIVAMLVYGYTRPISTTASARPSPHSSTASSVAPAIAPTVTPAPSAPAPNNR
jgi:hypothetical protein